MKRTIADRSPPLKMMWYKQRFIFKGGAMVAREPKTVLVLEDQALIALYMEELLRQAGFRHIATYSSCRDAMRWLEEGNPEFAVLETRLRDGGSEKIAETLSERGIPFVIHSVESETPDGHPEMEMRHRWIEKPCCPEDFIQAVNDCLQGSQGNTNRKAAC
jgi:DNA-binding NtrC family response regulator